MSKKHNRRYKGLYKGNYDKVKIGVIARDTHQNIKLSLEDSRFCMLHAIQALTEFGMRTDPDFYIGKISMTLYGSRESRVRTNGFSAPEYPISEITASPTSDNSFKPMPFDKPYIALLSTFIDNNKDALIHQFFTNANSDEIKAIDEIFDTAIVGIINVAKQVIGRLEAGDVSDRDTGVDPSSTDKNNISNTHVDNKDMTDKASAMPANTKTETNGGKAILNSLYGISVSQHHLDHNITAEVRRTVDNLEAAKSVSDRLNIPIITAQQTNGTTASTTDTDSASSITTISEHLNNIDSLFDEFKDDLLTNQLLDGISAESLSDFETAFDEFRGSIYQVIIQSGKVRINDDGVIDETISYQELQDEADCCEGCCGDCGNGLCKNHLGPDKEVLEYPNSNLLNKEVVIETMIQVNEHLAKIQELLSNIPSSLK